MIHYELLLWYNKIDTVGFGPTIWLLYIAFAPHESYQNMEKKDEEHEEQGMNALTEARPSESAELKNRVNG